TAKASGGTCRKPSRLASASADGVAPFRDFPVRRSSCAPLAAASLTRHRPVEKSAAVGTPAAQNWFLRCDAKGSPGLLQGDFARQTSAWKCKVHPNERATQRRARVGHHRKGRRVHVDDASRRATAGATDRSSARPEQRGGELLSSQCF